MFLHVTVLLFCHFHFVVIIFKSMSHGSMQMFDAYRSHDL